MEKKYELLKDTRKWVGNDPVYRIKALKSFGDVTEGDLGGWIEEESNLSQEGDCWVYDDSSVTGGIAITGDAQIHRSKIYGFSDSVIGGFSKITDCSIRMEVAEIQNSDLKSVTINGDADIIGSTIEGATIRYCSILLCCIKGDITVCAQSSLDDCVIYGDGILISGKDTKMSSSRIDGEDIKINGGTICSSEVYGHSIVVTNGDIESSLIYDDSTIKGGYIVDSRISCSTIYDGSIDSSDIEESIVLDYADICNISIENKSIVVSPRLYGEEGHINKLDSYRTYGPVTINNEITFEEQITLLKCEDKIYVAFSYIDQDTGEDTPYLYSYEEFIKGCPPHVQKVLNVLKEDLEY